MVRHFFTAPVTQCCDERGSPAAMLRHARNRGEEAVSAWLYLAWMVVEAAPAIYEASKEVEWSDPLAYAMCPSCKTLHALSDWKCPSCKGVLSFDVHRVEGKRKVFGSCAACGVYAPDFECTGCKHNMTDRF